MDREILFRGKVADEPDEWVQGYLRDADTIFKQTRHEKSKCCDYGFFSVKPDTVGQYIGICDKNGIKIFEGDIIKREDNILYVIRYIYGGFDSEPINEFYKEPKITWNTLGEMQNALWCMDNCEVIGNIHDNPELLEGL